MSFRIALLGIALLCWSGCSGESPNKDSKAGTAESKELATQEQKFSEEQQVKNASKEVFLSEEVIIALGPTLTNFKRSVANLALPDSNTRESFANEVRLLDVVDRQQADRESLESISTILGSWPVEEEFDERQNSNLQIWQPVFAQIDYFDWSKFAIKKGQFLDESKAKYKTHILFDAGAKLKSGGLISLSTSLYLKWKRETIEGVSKWVVYEWETKPFQLVEIEEPIFEDVLAAVLPDSQDYQAARTSIHEQLTVKILRGQIEVPPYFRVRELHPAISVVDINEDGYDDFYISRRHGRSLFYQSLGDGTYREVASELGIDVENYNISSIFADFDNDGDKDLFVGRVWEASKYFVNDGGKFTERADLFDSPLPFFVGSVNAVDFDSDGLLDIYVAVFGGKHALIRAKNELGYYPWPIKEVQELDRIDKAIGSQNTLDVPGLPSVLFRNSGAGKFERLDAPDAQVYRRTTQSVWSDFDGDGDPDIYLANDKGFNNLIRNDGGGNFVDVTAETKTADLGFGMGVTAGDYDNNGRSDIYVTNMYSKAGQRITGQLDSINQGFRDAARGNSLFRNDGAEFEKVSGLTPPSLMVEKVGWSWGSQFIDFDNDSFLDIYALSGHYTAPKQVAKPGDI